MQLSVLDQSMILSGQPGSAAISQTVATAKLCDALGYHRFWLSEHHNSPSIAGTAPEVLLAALAMVTTRIRLGAAGIMLPHYASLKVAEQFRVLEALAPGRIDLGVGRAPGAEMRTAFALNPNAAEAAKYFPAQIRDLIAWVSGADLPEGHPFRGIIAEPRGPIAAPASPQIWVLGSSDYGAQVAAHFGLPYAFAYFFADGMGAAEALSLYRENFKPSATQATPYAAIAVAAFAADTPDQAESMALARDVWRAERERGRFVPWPSPADTAAFHFTPAEDARRQALRPRSISGTGPHVVARLQSLAAELNCQEIALVTATYDPAARRRSFELIAQAAGLAPA